MAVGTSCVRLTTSPAETTPSGVVSTVSGRTEMPAPSRTGCNGEADTGVVVPATTSPAGVRATAVPAIVRPVASKVVSRTGSPPGARRTTLRAVTRPSASGPMVTPVTSDSAVDVTAPTSSASTVDVVAQAGAGPPSATGAAPLRAVASALRSVAAARMVLPGPSTFCSGVVVDPAVAMSG